ncbi:MULTISPECIES: A24 family peptidase [Marinomonas]|jgi:Flp pilus assembly protein, protease CpaA|uniref:Peptidase A24A prepilin type IV n=2 Tax=Marinomonas TaxID=28253 RepID=F2K0W0_MARM1|nr:MULTISPECIES: prepilin peptidase [Marinomonas]ADZ93309.1 peptidase A24A prepilin type IV [Marinomonas mediterranea MMB-1]TDO97539.1 prepilin peptidase CpaA [Marinomonas balearica]WCN11199.1 peptidase A24 [Marinomonas mediterranea]WCN15261.1 peptidase A24 [Marinomonas mediterranea]WCN19307.1 peptidase A24 [Marinomonas mediterranea MMB-1]
MFDFAMPVILTFASLWVIVTDLFYRRIHNRLVLMLLVLWLVSAALSLITSDENRSALLADFGYTSLGAVGVLLVGFCLFLVGQMGAGDVKLMSILCLWVGVEQQLTFLVVTALAGGVLALFLPFISLIELAGAKAILQLSERYPSFKIPAPIAFSREGVKGLPYGLAISVGYFYVLISPLFR